MAARSAIALTLWLVVTAPATADLFSVGEFTAYGDFRLRAEADWDSQDAAGVERDDRTRMRARLRAGFRLALNDHWKAEVRLRSGSEDSHQSPHVTLLDFDDNDTGDADFDVDRWYVQGSTGDLSIWAGRNDLPIWKQNEMLFDDDATMTGLGFAWSRNLGPGRLALAGGYLSPPAGMRRSSGTLSAIQVAFSPEFKGSRWTFAVGRYAFEADRNDPDAAVLLQGNGSRDYEIVAAGIQGRWSVKGRPLSIGADVMSNEENYSPADADTFTAANFDQTEGHVLQVTYGGLSDAGQWLFGYFYADIEALAINNSYAQDDWVRWGNATQTRASDLKGHEIRFGWAASARMNLLARLYLVEAITSVEDGTRFRIDFNYSF
jgi:hypothetical protein